MSHKFRKPKTEWKTPIKGGLWIRTWRLGEWLNAPLSPLFETFLLPVLASARETGGSGRFGWHLPRMWNVRTPSYYVVNGYFYARANSDLTTVISLPLRFLLSEARGGWVDRWESDALPDYLARLSGYSVVNTTMASETELLTLLNDLALDVAECWYALALAAGGAIPLQHFLRRVVGSLLETELGGDDITLIRGLRTKIMEEQESLYELAQAAARSPEITRCLEQKPISALVRADIHDPILSAFQRQIAVHLSIYGHQVTSLDFAFPHLAEEPTGLAVALRCYMRPGAMNPTDMLATTAREREEATQRLRSMLGARRRALFDTLVKRAQGYATARENTTFHLQFGWPIFRTVFRELGRRLTARHVIDDPHDIYFLSRDEVWSSCRTEGRTSSLAAAAARRRALSDVHRALLPPTHIPPKGDPAWQRAMKWPVNVRGAGVQVEQGTRVLIGRPASPGRRRARARVLGFLAESDRLGEGEVLVTAATTPAWTPLFSRASAIVTDVGGQASHSSTVAREYRIPAVVGTHEATRVIRDGDTLTVDGSAGKVYLG